jgi:hypothetical protein
VQFHIGRMQLATVAGLVGMALSTPGWAQQVGTYAGQSSDGSPVSFTVAQGTNGLEIDGSSVSFNAKCKGSTRIVPTGWGFFLGQPVKNHKAVLSYTGSDYFYISGDATFSGTQMTGKILESVGVLAPFKKKAPTASQFCTSPSQAYTATFQAGRAGISVAKGAAVNFHPE